MNKHITGSLQRAAFAIIFGVAMLGLSYAVNAQEMATGVSVRSSGMTNGEHWELTWYDEERDWRWGLGYTATQKVPGPVLACGSLGSLGELCTWQPGKIQVESYLSGYVQRVLTYRRTYAALGIAVHPRREPLLSAPASFRTSLGWQIDKQWSIEWTHMSNARLKRPNWGQDLVVLRYAF